MLNLGLLNQALARIEAEPHRWNQSSWVTNENTWDESLEELYRKPPTELCGTTMCLAGHTLLESGAYTLAWKKYEADDAPSNKYVWFFNVLEGAWASSADGDAARALGLDPEDEIDATLISRLFLTTGYAKSSDSFAKYKERVQAALNDYFVEKIADLEQRLEKARMEANGEANDNIENLMPDPWALGDRSQPPVSDEPPF